MKKMLSILLAAVLCVGLLAGCGGSKPAATDASAPIKLGGIGPLTGGAAIYGNAAKNGATIAV